VREVNALRFQLPSDIYSIDIRKVGPSDVNILQVALVSEKASYKLLKEHADELKDRLEKVAELKKVEVSGAPEALVRVDLQLDKLAEVKIPVNVVLSSLQSEAMNIPGGSLTAGGKAFNVKTSGKFKDVEDIAGTVIYNANGKIIYLRDVAIVSFRNEEQKHITRLNGYRCVLINAAQKAGTNINAVQDKYSPVVAEFEKTLPANVKMYKHFDQAENVAQRLAGLGIDFLIAISLVLFTLLPLGIRASVIVMVTIPLSLALGLVGLNLFGISLNQLSIVGLVVGWACSWTTASWWLRTLSGGCARATPEKKPPSGPPGKLPSQ